MNSSVGRLVFYKCGSCNVFFETRDKCLSHRSIKHPTTVRKSAEECSKRSQDMASFGNDWDDGQRMSDLLLEEVGLLEVDGSTIADSVKLQENKRTAAIKGSGINCYHCKAKIGTPYKEGRMYLNSVTIFEDGRQQLVHCCCSKCLKMLLKS